VQTVGPCSRSWAADASSKFAVLGSRLASHGYPEFIARVIDQSGFEFEFDAEELSATIEEAMARAEQEMERLRESGIEVAPIPAIENLNIVTGDLQRINIDIEAIHNNAVRMQEEMQRPRIQMQCLGPEMRFHRNSADNELLAVIAALRDNARAAVRALGDTELTSAVPLVLDTYRSNTDEQVRRAAIRALRRLNDHPAAIEGLLEVLEDQLNQPVDQ